LEIEPQIELSVTTKTETAKNGGQIFRRRRVAYSMIAVLLVLAMCLMLTATELEQKQIFCHYKAGFDNVSGWHGFSYYMHLCLYSIFEHKLYWTCI
jgi:hypothetical protein